MTPAQYAYHAETALILADDIASLGLDASYYYHQAYRLAVLSCGKRAREFQAYHANLTPLFSIS